ncbi:glycosyltransferase [Paractinoplanes lichenicola]|uniref:Glycosyltransferase n=1 Tax=Paractinoplanes lichenicola TaxID=2802976 RepID=A0ABS1W0G1_9ACTN|nr:glycosyltransferase [Actinoplanes lichenicola]MBL7260226.1 glycosyltransferase [Actinoplanes lichenicola]
MTGPVVIFSASIGAGHDGAAAELARRLGEQGLEVLRHDFLDMLPPGVGRRIRDGYARQLNTLPQSWGWLLNAMGGPRMSAGAAGLSASLATTRMLAAIPADAAVVVSTYPLASQVLGRLRGDGRLSVPVAAVMTDPSVHPLCAAAGVDVHLAPGLATADQLRRLGVPTLAVSPIVRPEFRPVTGPAERDATRRRLGLPADERLAVVVAGSWGVGDVAATARDITATGLAVPVVVCGRNEILRRRIGRDGSAIALGWVDAMPELLRCADVVVHNAGGLSSAEAMAGGVPVISYRCLPGHGVANAAVLARAGLSPWPRSATTFAEELSRAMTATPAPQASAEPDAADLIAALAGSAPLIADPLQEAVV